MGSGASSGTAAVGIEIISPRVPMTKKGPKEVILDSVPLSDVGSGTIHYRYRIPVPSVHDSPKIDKREIPTGYFFHPKLKDYSELGNSENEEACKFIRVANGPRRYQNQNVYYVSGIGFHGTNNEIPPSLISTVDSNQSGEKVYGHKYFEITLEDKGRNEVVEFVDGVEILNDKEVKMRMASSNCVKVVKRMLGHHYRYPLAIVHIHTISGEEVMDECSLKDLFSVTHNGSDIDVTLRLALK